MGEAMRIVIMMLAGGVLLVICVTAGLFAASLALSSEEKVRREQLRRMGIQGELHTLAKRPHCFQRNASPGTGSYTYLDRIWEFLSAKDFVK